ncbi:hypothetical protein ZIOFF_025226 [Zingiber officinale]|uniref:Glycine cleavage system H protein n=1 Tax=Zingiber officinale TaxID=94328 RepID=A0A8J5H1G2_ZINOF|nr:hypothetical protein ZIOFF_025226 [Zingiber officinale]
MASRLLWASRVASYLKISTCPSAFSIDGEGGSVSHDAIATCESPLDVVVKFSLDSNYLLTVIKDLKYANTHEWVKVDGSTATIGITDHAQDHLGDVVYIALLEVGSYVKQGKNFGAVESVKVNASPFEDGWIVKVKSSNDGEVNSLMDSEQYSKFYEEEDAKH